MSVKIIFPPFAEHALSGPFLAPYLIVAILEKENIPAEAIDFNIRFIRKIIDPAIIQSILSENLASIHDAKILTHFISVPLADYIHYSTDGLIYVLQILRKILIPQTIDFDSCLSCKPNYNTLITDIYIDLIDQLKLEQNDVVGFSIPFAEQFTETLFLANTIKKLHPELKMIVGGSQINLLNENQIKALQNTDIFSVISKGDAESGITNLILNINKFKNSTIVRFPPVNQNILDKIPFPVYNNTKQYLGTLIFPILATKGCYWGKCSFCDYIKLSDIQNKNYIARKPETALDEIRKLDKEFEQATFFLISDAVPPVWYKNLCKLAIDTGFKLKTWSYLIHSEIYNRNFFELLSDAGVKAITFGTESLNDRLLNVLQKNFTKEIIKKNLYDTSDLKFSVTVNIIPDIPSASYEESLENLKELHALSSYFETVNIQPFVLTADTLMSKYPEKFGIEILLSESIKTNHGFHSLTYIDLLGMSDDKRKIALHTYHEFSVKMKIQKRTKSLLYSQIQDETILYFDTTTFVIDGEMPELFTVSLKTRFIIEKWEVDFFNNLFFSQNRIITLSEIRELYNIYSMQGKDTFLKYFFIILKRGIIISSGTFPQKRGNMNSIPKEEAT